jgi:serine/threonine-protein kinase RsbW
MHPTRIWLAITADFHMVRLAAAGLQGILAELGCDAEQADLIELCAVEAMNNVVEHAYPQDHTGRLELQLTPTGDQLELVLRDHGRPMPPEALSRARGRDEAAAPEPRDGGYGLGLIVDLMSDVTYHRADDTNALTMTTILRRNQP